MSSSKFIVGISFFLFGCAHAQTVSELAEVQRAKQAAEIAFVKNASDAIALNQKMTTERAKPAIIRTPVAAAPKRYFTVHSVIYKGNAWFAEVARNFQLSRAVPGTIYGDATVTSVNSQGVVLSYSPESKCLKKQSKLKGKQAGDYVCPPVTRMVAVGEKF